jgi:hypothetical protein
LGPNGVVKGALATGAHKVKIPIPPPPRQSMSMLGIVISVGKIWTIIRVVIRMPVSQLGSYC